MREENQGLRDEIARLKGEKGKPTLKKNVSPPDKNDPAKAALQPSKKHRKRAKKANLPVDEVRTISLDKSTLPPMPSILKNRYRCNPGTHYPTE